MYPLTPKYLRYLQYSRGNTKLLGFVCLFVCLYFPLFFLHLDTHRLLQAMVGLLLPQHSVGSGNTGQAVQSWETCSHSLPALGPDTSRFTPLFWGALLQSCLAALLLLLWCLFPSSLTSQGWHRLMTGCWVVHLASVFAARKLRHLLRGPGCFCLSGFSLSYLPQREEWGGEVKFS